MLRIARASVGFSFFLAVLAGCSSSSTTVTDSGVANCGDAGCGLNATCNVDTSGNAACECYATYTSCPDGDGGQACVQELTDSHNCNGCGIVCPSGQTCQGGACACNETVCPGLDGGPSVCTDIQNDANNCNGCGKACAEGESCILGQCVCSTTTPGIAECQTDAGLACVDTTHDDGNCGGCGVECASNQHCDNPGGGQGTCLCNEEDGGPPTIVNCGGTCVDTTNDPFNCGGCGQVCVSGSCIQSDAGTGICNCPQPYTQCGPDCVDTFSDINHCGSCDNDCTIVGQGITELSCNLGRCYCGPTGQGTICPDGTCASLLIDPQNCGTCGNVCLAPAQDCVNGTCACAQAQTLCGQPDAGIPLFCIDTTQDINNCGTCGHNCIDTFATNSGCRFGSCQCAPGQQHLCATPSSGGALPTCDCAFTQSEPNCSTPSFATDIYPLLAQQSGTWGCAASGCHSGAAPAAGLAFLDSDGNMDAGMAFAELLGTGSPPPPDAGIPFCDGGLPPGSPATQCGCVSRVVAGNENASYLIDTVTNDLPCAVLADGGKICAQSCLAAMPIDDGGGWVPLDKCSQQLLIQWVHQGAAP